MKKMPHGLPLISTPESVATPPAASTSAMELRALRVNAAATAIGPMNSITTLFPNGSRSSAR